jgi:thioredoxin-related protein
MMKQFIPLFLLLLFILADFDRGVAQSGSLNWNDFNSAITSADHDGKTLVLFFEAEWCGFCKQMRSEVFPQRSVQAEVGEGFVPVAIDIESEEKIIYQDREMSQKSFSHQMRIDATPTIMFMSSEGEVIGRYRGFADENEFILLLEYIRGEDVENVDFAEYKKRNNGTQN